MSQQTVPVSVRAGVRGRSAAAVPDLTIVVPTRNERGNVSRLVERLEGASPWLLLEVLFVDDSSDDTPGVIRERATRSSLSIRLIHRPENDRPGGLGGAVHAGLMESRSEWVCVMDADLQHPPEALGALVDEACRSEADVVVASRYRGGGDLGGFSRFRKAVSRGSGLLAHALFPRRLRGLSDPMSGFFLVRRAAVDLSALRPRGFKVLLEILLCGRRLVTSEVGFCFGERYAGESKASLGEGARYVWRLVELRAGARGLRLVGFGAVGAVGVVVNTVMLHVLTATLDVFYLLASVVATQVAILSNYVLAELVVFRGVQPVRSLRGRLTSYVLFNNCSLALTAPLLVVLVSVLGIGLLVANLLSLVALFLVRFAVADAYVWGPTAPPERRPSAARASGAASGLIHEKLEPS